MLSRLHDNRSKYKVYRPETLDNLTQWEQGKANQKGVYIEARKYTKMPTGHGYKQN